jgi:hypothetical protein
MSNGPAPRGKCVLISESGLPYAVRVDYSQHTIDVDISYYEQRGHQPPWQTLAPCQMPESTPPATN